MESIEPKFTPLQFAEVERDEQFERGKQFFELLLRRRTVREYSDREVPIELSKLRELHRRELIYSRGGLWSSRTLRLSEGSARQPRPRNTKVTISG